jgi:uridine phosphorylase
MSIIASQMGFPNMDFVIRECRAIVEGPMHIVRLGTCGCPRPDVPVGSVVTADDGTVAIIRNPDGFFPDATPEDVAGRYIFTRPILPDAALQSLVSAEIDASLESEGKGTMHVGGVNASADTFYASQGRQDDNFRDENETLVDDLVAKYPTICAIEMETHQLFSLAQVSAEHARIFAAGAAIVLAQRRSNDFLTNDRKHELEHTLGLACLEALAKVESTPVPTSAVWL